MESSWDVSYETAAPQCQFKDNLGVLMSKVHTEMSSKPQQQYGTYKHLHHLIFHT